MNKYAVIGLGYVGLGLATALSKHNIVIGYDINKIRIDELLHQVDSNNLIPLEELSSQNITYTHNLDDIKQANFFIISVATPAYCYEIPDLQPLINASKNIASVIKKGDIIVFESTVYPGTTEEVCIPILEEFSQLKNGRDFHVGYSPERINPGDKNHTLKTITKVVGAQNENILNTIINAYKTICDNVYPVSSIATAEATKLLENTQRDVNIAIMNEYTKLMHALNIDMHEVINAAKTKWGFIPFKPGFVGGHCISIDPHYFAFKAKRHGIQPELILAARRVNDGITQFVIQSMIKLLIKNNIDKNNLTIGIFGVSYKENVLDLRNSLAMKLIKELREYGFNCQVHDPLVPLNSPKIKLDKFENLNNLSVSIIAVGHDYYKNIGLETFLLKGKQPNVIMDIPNLFVTEHQRYNSLIYWNL